MIRCVAFDLDGTLVDSNQIKHQSFVDIAGGFDGGSEVIDEVLRAQPGDRFQIFARFAELWNERYPDRSPAKAAALSEAYTRRCEELIVSAAEFPGAVRILNELALRKIAAAVVSATPSVPLDALVRRKGWHDRFTHVIGGATDKSVGLAELATRVSLPPAAMAMVGDKQVDQAGARAFGCAFIGVRRRDNDFTQGPTMMVDDLAEILPLLDRLEATET